MKKIGVLLLISAALGLGQTPGPGDPNRAADDMDRAHRPIFQPPPDKAKIASEVTAEVRQAAARAARQAKIARRNYIDEAIFAPHGTRWHPARRASD